MLVPHISTATHFQKLLRFDIQPERIEIEMITKIEAHAAKNVQHGELNSGGKIYLIKVCSVLLFFIGVIP